MNRTLVCVMGFFLGTAFSWSHTAVGEKIGRSLYSSVRHMNRWYSAKVAGEDENQNRRELCVVEGERVHSVVSRSFFSVREQQLKDMYTYFLRSACDYFYAYQKGVYYSPFSYEEVLSRFRLLSNKEAIIMEYRNCFGILKAYCDFSHHRDEKKEKAFAKEIAEQFVRKILTLIYAQDDKRVFAVPLIGC